MAGLICNDALRSEIDPHLPCAPTTFSLQEIPNIREKILALQDLTNIREWHFQEHNDCQAHSATDCGEKCYWVKTGKMVQLARNACYAMCRIIDGSYPSDQGSSMQSGVKMFKQYGCPTEAMWPYPTPQLPVRDFQKRWDASDATEYKFDGEIVASPNFDAAVGIILAYGSISIGIDWDPNGFRLDRNGIARSYSGLGGGHALDADFIQYVGNELVLRIANSHSPKRNPLAVPGNCFYVTEEWWNKVVPRSRYGVYGWVPSAAREIVLSDVHWMGGEKR